MEARRFDGLARSLVGVGSRRRVLAALAGLIGGSVGGGRRGAKGAQPTCPAGLTACNGECVDVMTDRRHCGECRRGCSDGGPRWPSDKRHVCIAGICQRVCEAPYVDDGEWQCINLKFDPVHCGACHTICQSGICANGVCEPPLPVAASPERVVGTFTVTELGVGEGNWGVASWVDESGLVGGMWGTASWNDPEPLGPRANLRPFRWRNGSFADPGVIDALLAADAAEGGRSSFGDAMEIVDFQVVRVYRAESGRIETIDLSELGGKVESVKVNGRGDVAGVFRTKESDQKLFFRRDGRLSSFALPAEFRIATVEKLNDQGQAVGGLERCRGKCSGFGVRGFVLTEAGIRVMEADRPDRTTWALDANEAGQVLGVFGAPWGGRNGQAFIYEIDSESYTTLGGIDWYGQFQPRAINNHGQVVGTASAPVVPDLAPRRVVLFDRRIGRMVALDDLISRDSGWDVADARDINNAGWIVGQGWFDGDLHACLLTPVPPRAPSERPPLSDEQDVANRNQLLFELERRGSFGELYEWLHPDAQAVIPHAAVVGWYRDEVAPRHPESLTITELRFVSWTWPVTWAAYPYAARVDSIQSFADGSSVADVMHLVRAKANEWRWFFGRDRAFLDALIAKYGSDDVAE